MGHRFGRDRVANNGAWQTKLLLSRAQQLRREARMVCHRGRHDGHNVFLGSQVRSTWRRCHVGLRLSTKFQVSTFEVTRNTEQPEAEPAGHFRLAS